MSRKIALPDISVAFRHADLPQDEAIAVIPPRGEGDDGIVWQLRKAMYGTRRASLLFAEFMVKVYVDAGYQALACSRQLFY